MPTPINLTPIASAWRFIIAQQPTTFTFATATVVGFLSDVNQTTDLGLGGFTQGLDTRLFCLRSDFTTVPVEGDIIPISSVNYRVSAVQVVKSFGVVFTLEGPSKP